MPQYEIEDEQGVYQFDSDTELDDAALQGFYDAEIARPRKREETIQSAANALMEKDDAALAAVSKASGPAWDLLNATNLALGGAAAVNKSLGNNFRAGIDNVIYSQGSDAQRQALEQSDLKYDSIVNKALIALPPEERESAMEDIRALADVSRGYKDVAMVNGQLRLNPELVWAPDKATAAIQSATAEDDQKQSLIAALPALRKRAAEAELPVFNELSEFQDFKKAHPELTAPEDQIQVYKDENSDWYDKLGAQAKLGLAQGRAQLAQQIQGVAGATLHGIGKLPGGDGLKEIGDTFIEAAAVDSAKESEKLAQQAQAVGGSPLVSEVTAGATSTLAPMLVGAGASRLAGSLARNVVSEAAATRLASNAGFAGAVGASGLQSFGSTYPQAVAAFEQQFIAEGMDPVEAREKAADAAYLPAALSGISTAAVTAIGGKTGVESVFRLKEEGFKATVRTFFSEVLKDTGSEALEEAVDEYSQGLIALHSYDPSRSMADIVEGAFKASAMGGLIGGGVSTLKSITETWEKQKVAPAVELARNSGAPETADALESLATQESERKWAAAEEALAGTQQTEVVTELSGFDPAAPSFSSDDSAAVREAKIQAVLATKEGKSPEEQAAIDQMVAEVRTGPPALPTTVDAETPVSESPTPAVQPEAQPAVVESEGTASAPVSPVQGGVPQTQDLQAAAVEPTPIPTSANETATSAEVQSVPEPAESTPATESIPATEQAAASAEGVVKDSLTTDPVVRNSRITELADQATPPQPEEAGEDAGLVYEQRAAKVTNPEATGYAEMERNDAQVYPAPPVPAGAELRWAESGKKGTKGIRPNTWLPTVTLTSGQVVDYFTNRTDTTAQQLDKGRTIEVPANFVQSGALNPRINVRKEGDRYFASSVEHPRFGRIQDPGSYSRAYKSDDQRATKQRQQTGGGSTFQSKYDRFDPSPLEPVAQESSRMQAFEKAADRARGSLEESFTPEIVDQLISTARQYHLYRLRSGDPSSPSTTLNMVRADYAEKVAARPEAQQQASLDAPVGEGTTTTGDLLSIPDESNELSPADRARSALADVLGKLAPAEAEAWAEIAEKIGRDEALDEAEQAIWERVSTAAREAYEVDEDTLRSAIRSGAMSADMAAQATWLSEQARSEGFQSLSELVAAAPKRFTELAQQWRTEHPQTYAPNVYRSGPDPNPLLAGLRGALAEVAPGLKLGIGVDPEGAAMWVEGGTVMVDPAVLETVLAEHPEESRENVARKILDEEVAHIAGVRAIGRDEATNLGWNLDPRTADSVARQYILRSRYNSDADYDRAVEEFKSQPYRLAHEYLRMLSQRLRTGQTTEDLVIPQNPGFIATIGRYMRQALAWLRTRLDLAFNAELAAMVNRLETARRGLSMRGQVMDDLGLTESDLAGAEPLRSAAGSRLDSTSLHRILSTVDPETERLLGQKEYISDTINNTERLADEWIDRNGGVSNVTQGDELLAKVDGSYLADEQQQMVKAKIALKYKTLMEAIAAGPALPEKAMLFDHLKRQHQRILVGLQEQGSRTGQLLSLFKGISKLFVPDTFRRQYVGKLTKEQAAGIEGTPGATEVAGALDTGRAAGAKAAVTRGLKALKKLMPENDPAQAVFDFFAEVFDKQAALFGTGSGLPVRTEIANDVAERISALMLKKSGVRTQEPLFDILNKKVREAVQKQLIEREAKPEITDEEELQSYLESLTARVMNAGLVEEAFNAAVQSTLAETPRPMEARIARLEGLKFDQANYLNAAEFVTKALNFKDLVTQTLQQQDSALFNLLASLTSSTGLEGEQARLLGEAIQSAYDLEAKRVARQRLEAIVRAKEPKIRITEPKIVKLLKLVNLGAFSEEKFYNAIAESYGLPSYNEEFADEVEQRGAEIQKMPESDVKNEATRKLLSDIARERVKGYKFGQKVKYYLGDVAPAIWQAGILSGVPTHLVNYFSSQTNILLSATADAAGYVAAARKAGIKTANTRDFMADVMIGWLRGSGLMKSSGENATAQEVQKALTTGTTRFRNEKGEEFSVLESEPLGVLHKYIGRLMVATDVMGQMSANEIKQRMALRYLWLQEGKTKEEISKLMDEAFNPAKDVLEQIDAQVEAESPWLKSKLDKSRRRTELIEKRRFELMAGLDQVSRDSAAKWTFNEDTPTGLMGYIVNRVIEPFNRTTKIGRFVFPFMRTLASIINNTFDWSPVGILRGYNISATKLLGLEKYQRDFASGSPEQYAQLAKAWTGTLAIIGIAAAMVKGLQDEEEGKEPFIAVYGEGPTDRNLKTQLEQGSSWQANTIKVGPARIRFTDFPVLSFFLGAMGKASDLYRYEDYDERGMGEIALKGTLAIGSSIMEKNLLSGLSSLMEVITADDEMKSQAAKRYASGIVGGYTNPQLFKWARDTMGMNERGMVPVLDKTSTMEGWLMSLVPFSAGYNQPYLNVLGEPIEKLPWEATTKRFGLYDGTPDHPILTPLVDAGLFLAAPSKNTTITINGEKVRVGSDPELWRKFVIARGEEIKKQLTPKQIERLQGMDKDRAQSYLDDRIGGKARDVAKTRLEREYRTRSN